MPLMCPCLGSFHTYWNVFCSAGSAYAAIGNLVYSRDLDVPNHLKRQPKTKGFQNIEKDIVDAIHVAYGGSAKAK